MARHHESDTEKVSQYANQGREGRGGGAAEGTCWLPLQCITRQEAMCTRATLRWTRHWPARPGAARSQGADREGTAGPQRHACSVAIPRGRESPHSG